MRPPPSTSTPFSRCSVRLARVGRVRVVRDHDDGLAVLAVERLQQVEDLVARLAIEVAGRLVAEQQRRIGDDRARDADALLLAARELPRVVLARDRPRPTTVSAIATRLRRSAFAELRQQQRQLDVALGGQHRQQVVELEDEADVLRAPAPTARRPTSLSMRSPPTSIAPSRRRVEPADQVEQRRLARAGRAHQREEIALRNVEVDALEHVDALAAAREVPCGRRGR